MTAPRWSPQDERRLARIDKEIERYGFQGGDQSWLVTKLREARQEIERLTKPKCEHPNLDARKRTVPGMANLSVCPDCNAAVFVG